MNCRERDEYLLTEEIVRTARVVKTSSCLGLGNSSESKSKSDIELLQQQSDMYIGPPSAFCATLGTSGVILISFTCVVN